MSQSKITRSALGSVAKLGDLYDARYDTFCGISILKDCAPKSAIQTRDSPFCDSKYIYSDKYSEKFEKLDVNAELKLSVLCGMSSLEGSGRYLRDEKSSKRAVRCTLMHNICTKVEELSIYNDSLKECISLDALKHDATHVVIGITWGANLMVTAECTNEENEDTMQVEGDLEAELNKIKFAISGKAEIDYGKGDAEKGKQFSLNIYGDVLPEGDLPQNIDEAMELMKKLPNLIKKSNDGKGKPLQYVLLPVDVLKSHFKVHITVENAFKKLTEHEVLPFVQLFDQIMEAKQRLNDLNSDVKKHSLYLSKSTMKDLNQLKSKADISASRIRDQLSKLVVEVRQGNTEMYELEKLREKYEEDPYSAENLLKQLDQFADISEKIQTYKHLATNLGVIFVPNTENSLDKMMLQHHGKDLYILFSESKARTENESLWSEQMNLFISLIHERNPSKRKDQPGSSQGPQSAFLYVDLDIIPRLTPQGNQVIVVQHFKNGICVVPDLLEVYGKRSSLCLVKSDAVGARFYFTKIATKHTIPLEIRCPSSFSGRCETDVRKWACFKCKKFIEFLGNSYQCQCGYARAETFSYRCCSKKHGDDFEIFNPDESTLDDELGPLRKKKQAISLDLVDIGAFAFFGPYAPTILDIFGSGSSK